MEIAADDWVDLLEDSFVMAQGGVRRLAGRVDEMRRRAPPLGGFDAPSGGVARPPKHLVDLVLLLRDVPLFSRTTTQTLVSLAEAGTTVNAREGEIVFGRGAMADTLAVVASGEVEATRDGLSGRFRRGALVGGAGALVSGGAYEVRARADVILVAIRIEDYFDIMEEHFSLARSAFMSLAEELESLLDRGQSAD